MSAAVQALNDFNEVLADAVTLAETWLTLAGDDVNAPQWPSAVHAMVRRLEMAAASMEQVIRGQA